MDGSRVISVGSGGDVAVQDSALQTPTLLNSWVAFGAGLPAPEYWKDALGYVHLKGAIKDGTTTPGTSFFVLPEGYRPEEDTQLVTISNNGSSSIVSRVSISASTGAVGIQDGGNTWFILNGIYFLADTT